MAKLALKRGSTSKIIRLFVQDSSQSDGRGLTGLTNASGGLVAYQIREGQAAATAITLAAGTVGTWSSGGFKEVDATNLPGVYELGLPDVALSTGNSAIVMLRGATNMVPVICEIELDAYDPQDATRLGLTALPNASAGAVGGLPTGDASGRVTVVTNADKAGYSLTVTPPTAAAISTAVWGETTRSLTDKIGFALSAAGVQAIWDALVSVLTTAGSVGKRLADNLDATVSGRASAADYTTARAAKLDNLDATTSSRLASAGYTAPDNATIATRASQASVDTIAGYIDTEVAAIKAKTDNLPASPAAVGSAMTLDLTQAVPTSNTAQTVGDALNAARAQGFGKWALTGTSLVLYAPDGTTIVRTFTLDSATSPTSRT